MLVSKNSIPSVNSPVGNTWQAAALNQDTQFQCYVVDRHGGNILLDIECFIHSGEETNTHNNSVTFSVCLDEDHKYTESELTRKILPVLYRTANSYSAGPKLSRKEIDTFSLTLANVPSSFQTVQV